MKPFYIFLLSILPTLLFAQSNYQPGYILKSNGDTVKGYIDYREWDQSPEVIDFKVNKTDKEFQQFKPENIRGFTVDTTESYISYHGPVSMDHNHFPELAESLDTTKSTATLFLKLVTSGSHISFYSQADQLKTRYFVAEGSGTPAELIYNQYLNSQHEAIERAIFRGQLIFYANKYAPSNTKLISEAEQAAFENDQLAGIVYKINGDTSVRINGHNEPSHFRFFIGAGIFRAQNDANTATFPQFSLGFDKFDNPGVQKMILRVSLSITPISAKVAYSTSISPNNTLSFDQFNFSLTPQIIYNLYNKDNFKVYIGGGVSFNLSSTSGYTLKYDDVSSPDHTSPDPNFSSFWVNFPLQTGIMISKRWDVSFTYAPYTKFNPNEYNKASNYSFGLGLKVFLGD